MVTLHAGWVLQSALRRQYVELVFGMQKPLLAHRLVLLPLLCGCTGAPRGRGAPRGGARGGRGGAGAGAKVVVEPHR